MDDDLNPGNDPSKQVRGVSMQHEARMPVPVAARKQVADMVQNPSAYFDRAWAEASQLADQQIEREHSVRVKVGQKEPTPESKGFRYLVSKAAQKKAARERLRLRQEKMRRAKLLGRNPAVEIETSDGKKLIVKVVVTELPTDGTKRPADVTKGMPVKMLDSSIHVMSDVGVNRSGKHVAIVHQSKVA